MIACDLAENGVDTAGSRQALAGEIADGVVLNYLVSPSYNVGALDALARGAAKVGRDLDDIDPLLARGADLETRDGDFNETMRTRAGAEGWAGSADAPAPEAAPSPPRSCPRPGTRYWWRESRPVCRRYRVSQRSAP